jgi:hypothetical protein
MKALSQLAYKCGETETMFNFNCSSDNPIMDVIMTIFNWLSVGVVVVVIIFVVVGAIQYMTGSQGGSGEKASGGISTIRNAVMALGLYFVMWALVNYLVPGGVFK